MRQNVIRAKWTIITVIAVLVSSTTQSVAHVNWFVDGDSERLPNVAITEPVFIGWLIIAALMVLVSIWLDGKLPTFAVAQSKLRHDFMEILRVFTGMSFLLTAY